MFAIQFQHFYLMRKRTILSLLALASAINVFAGSNKFTYDGIRYEIISEDDMTLAVIEPGSYSSYSGDIVIPASVTYNNQEYHVKGIKHDAFEDCSNLTSITIPQGVTYIDGGAFRSCSSLSSITIPNSVTSIGYGAFGGTAWYNNQPDGLVYAGNVAYKYKGTMPDNTSVIITDGTLGIAEGAFDECEGLVSIKIPTSVMEIGDGAFEYCSGLTSIEIPESIKVIKGQTFEGCSSLKAVTIPNSVVSIEGRAFGDCKSLETFEVPDNVYYIDTDAFNGTAWYKAQPNGVIYLGTTAYTYKGEMPQNTSIEIKEGTKKINSSAFYGERNLKSVIIPDGVISIGFNAFCDCEGIDSITLPNSITDIGDGAFASCKNLKSIIIPEKIKYIPVDFVAGCANLRSITIPQSVETISNYAFVRSGLVSINIPSGVTAIKDNAFAGCEDLVAVTIPASVTNIGSEIFDRCTKLAYITSYSTEPYLISCDEDAFYGVNTRTCVLLIPDGEIYQFMYHDSSTGPWCKFSNIWSIGDNVVDGISYAITSSSDKTVAVIPLGTDEIGTELKYQGRIVIPGKVTLKGDEYSVNSISDFTFMNSTGLTSIVVSEGVTQLGSAAFSGCSGLKSVKIPSSVNMIEGNLFEECSNIDTIIWHSNQHPFYALLYCRENVKHVELRNTMTTLDVYMFPNCRNLESVILPGSLTKIDGLAFENCSSLKSIIIPDKVSVIGHEAFKACKSLTYVTLPSALQSLGDQFLFCRSIKAINIPSNVKTIRDNPFYYCDSLTSITVDPQNTVFDSREGCNGIIETATNTLIVGCVNTIIPSTVTSVGSYAFSRNIQIERITIPNNVTNIGDGAFSGCGKLQSISIPNDITYIGKRTFSLCASLKTINLPDSLKNINEEAFSRCVDLESINFPKGLTGIGDYAFNGCEKLDSIYLPSNTKAIGLFAFGRCDSLRVVYSSAVTPPLTGEYPNIFSDETYEKAILYVPEGSETAYGTASGWNLFHTIKTFKPTDVESVIDSIEADIVPLYYYDLSGNKTDIPQRGFNIIKYSNGQTKKVFIEE